MIFERNGFDGSTTRRVTRQAPDVGRISGGLFKTQLFSPDHPQRRGEGGLRKLGYFKAGGYFDQGPGGAEARPLVTVITVVFNGAAHIEHAILSVLNQTYDNVEYVIVDGGSTDGTVDLIRKYEAAIDYWVSEPDGGISAAFNKGLQLATGAIIGILNADDWYDERAVEAVVATLNTGGPDIVYGEMQYWRNGQKTELVPGDHDLLERDMTINHPTVFVKTAIYKAMGMFRTDYRLAMDYELLIRAKKLGASFGNIGSCIANQRRGGVSDRRWNMALYEVARAQALHTPGRVRPWVAFAYKVTKGTVRRRLERLGLRSVVNFYRAKKSAVRRMTEGIRR